MDNKLDSETIKKFRQGDENAFELVFKAFHTRVFNFVRKLIGCKDEAEEITSDVFVALYSSCRRCKNVEHVKNYLFLCARHRVINYWKSKKNDHYSRIALEIYLNNEALLENEYFIKADIEETLYKAIEELPEECKKIFKLLFYESLKPAEVADKLNISVSTVYVQKQIAIQKLRLALGDDDSLIA
ncbi:hypothetical protein A4H97_22875 [Niastella yeongjuensis]|uniref:RNA polymerase sigma factor 70 region 4 type 2 domain-containing protein n=1 Tax=Niastella yeongjuensis TaxID=354355 RepID=A0A1V9F7C4_9BACT|nr:RNA polymerase sigma-70 factor [Niastella yeongjuensis]OQP54330.1 hypothetical protein A4H97_22875 [Niastella yeongjuensis]SEP30095.1 RNA polymerase sigma-70 factor, ECF subfamily [Niastella yeongjuensis]